MRKDQQIENVIVSFQTRFFDKNKSKGQILKNICLGKLAIPIIERVDDFMSSLSNVKESNTGQKWS